MEPNIQLHRPDGTSISIEVHCANEGDFWNFWKVIQKGWDGPGYGRSFSCDFDKPGRPFTGLDGAS